jgi:hypothetical protein
MTDHCTVTTVKSKQRHFEVQTPGKVIRHSTTACKEFQRGQEYLETDRRCKMCTNCRYILRKIGKESLDEEV